MMIGSQTWPTRTLRDLVADVFVGLSLSRRKAATGEHPEVPILSVGDISGGGHTPPLARLPRKRLSLLAQDERYRVHRGDVLVSARATQLKIGHASKSTEGAIVSSTLIVVRPGSDVLSTVVFAALRSPVCRGHMNAVARQSTSTTILNVGDLLDLALPVPPEHVQQSIHELVELGERHYRVARELAIQRRVLAHRVAQKMMFGELRD